MRACFGPLLDPTPRLEYLNEFIRLTYRFQSPR